jgi:hypothetical protein
LAVLIHDRKEVLPFVHLGFIIGNMKKGRKKREKTHFKSPTKRRVLLLLQAGLALGLTPSPRAHFYIFKELAKEWRDIDRKYLYQIVREFYQERFVDWQEKPDGSIKIVLSEEGKKRVLEYNFDELKIKKPAVWDNKWRVVFFDIPERRRQARDALRKKLRDLGFCELQKSVFVCPFSCRDEIDFVVEFFNIRPFVRYAEMMSPTNEAELKIKFGLK